mgnify:CR=1 FL=1
MPTVAAEKDVGPGGLEPSAHGLRVRHIFGPRMRVGYWRRILPAFYQNRGGTSRMGPSLREREPGDVKHVGVAERASTLRSGVGMRRLKKRPGLVELRIEGRGLAAFLLDAGEALD